MATWLLQINSCITRQFDRNSKHRKLWQNLLKLGDIAFTRGLAVLPISPLHGWDQAIDANLEEWENLEAELSKFGSTGATGYPTPPAEPPRRRRARERSNSPTTRVQARRGEFQARVSKQVVKRSERDRFVRNIWQQFLYQIFDAIPGRKGRKNARVDFDAFQTREAKEDWFSPKCLPLVVGYYSLRLAGPGHRDQCFDLLFPQNESQYAQAKIKERGWPKLKYRDEWREYLSDNLDDRHVKAIVEEMRKRWETLECFPMARNDRPWAVDPKAGDVIVFLTTHEQLPEALVRRETKAAGEEIPGDDPGNQVVSQHV